MTLNEAKELMHKAFVEYIDSLPCELIDSEEVHLAEALAPILEANKVIGLALEELKWYREQDLIKRGKAEEIVSKYGHNWLEKANIKVHLMEIPKAEPPHATVDERNGDCETCKHYYRQGELTYGFCADCIEKGMGKYEPYIPR